jgi:hypothetical protein
LQAPENGQERDEKPSQNAIGNYGWGQQYKGGNDKRSDPKENLLPLSFCFSSLELARDPEQLFSGAPSGTRRSSFRRSNPPNRHSGKAVVCRFLPSHLLSSGAR